MLLPLGLGVALVVDFGVGFALSALAGLVSMGGLSLMRCPRCGSSTTATRLRPGDPNSFVLYSKLRKACSLCGLDFTRYHLGEAVRPGEPDIRFDDKGRLRFGEPDGF
jgi:hypothetical protein